MFKIEAPWTLEKITHSIAIFRMLKSCIGIFLFVTYSSI